MSSAYPISAPVEFVNTTANDVLDFNAVVGQADQNVITDFVTEVEGDLIIGGPGNNLSRLPVGSSGQTLTVQDDDVAQVFSITTVAESALTIGDYFLFSAGIIDFYVYYDIDTSGVTDPAPSGRSGILVDVTSGDTADQVATKTKTALDGGAAGQFTTSISTNVITVTAVANGYAKPPLDSTAAPTDFTFAILATGSTSGTPVPVWQTSATATGVATVTATTTLPGGVASGATWVDLNSSVVTWTETGGDTNFDADGIYTAPAAGDYDVSAMVTFEANNRGNGTGFNGLRGVRQVQVWVDGSVVFAMSSKQAEAFNGNPTCVAIPSKKITLASGNTVQLRVRHDSSTTPLTILSAIDGNAGATYFSIHRVS